jgi:Protein of unknown function DUF262
MKKSSINWNVKQFIRMVDKGTISFDYPIQREGLQWDNLQKSLLIHSLAGDYPVPALYSVTEPIKIDGKEKKLYYILDGKQRLTNIKAFIKGEYFLHEDTPNVIIDDEEYELRERTFEELNERVREEIESFSLQIYKMDEITDEEIEDLFFRLNNGTPLSKQQKAKAKMGTEWAKKIRGLVSHEMMQEKAKFTPLQIKKADNETAILQTMMLIDDNHELKSISSNDVFKYSQTFRGNDDKDALVGEVKKAMDYINLAFDDKEPVLLKKVHLPMTMLTALYALENEIHPLEFSKWRDEFKKSLKEKEGSLPTDYKEYSGAGSVKGDRTLGRVTEMKKHMDLYFENNSQSKVEELDKETVSEIATTLEPK